jgi:hypothetical protein
VNIDGDSRRNPIHILWCWTLILIRSLTETLHNDNTFITTISNYLKQIENRILRVLDMGNLLDLN